MTEKMFKENITPVIYLIPGGAAGALASALTVPFDVVKTRLQTQASTGVIRYAGIFDAFKKIAVDEGFKGFTRGLSARMVYVTPGAHLIVY